jgi:hypothetical protein
MQLFVDCLVITEARGAGSEKKSDIHHVLKRNPCGHSVAQQLTLTGRKEARITGRKWNTTNCYASNLDMRMQ